MKHGIKLLVGTLILSATLTACGKSGGGSSAAATPGAGAAGACSLNAQGLCVGGVTSYGAVAPNNTWSGNVAVNNQPKYLQFLNETRDSSGRPLCYGMTCTRVSGFFGVVIQTIQDNLPNAVNFSIVPRFSGFQGGRLDTQADAYVNASNNGFQLVYNRFNGLGMNNGLGFTTAYQYRPGVAPYGVPVNQAVPAAQNASLQIVLTYLDSVQTIANVVVLYQGTQFATGQLRGQIPMGLGINGTSYFGSPQSQAAPAVLPFQGQTTRNY